MTRRGERSPRQQESPGGRVMLAVAVLLVAAATGTLALTDSIRWLRLGIVAALWAALAGAFVAARYRRQAADRAEDAAEMQQVYEAELESEVAARREYELELRAELAAPGSAAAGGDRADLEELRAEIRALRSTLESMIGGEVLVERVALHAQSTRMRSVADVGALPGRGGERRIEASRRVDREAHTELMERAIGMEAATPRRTRHPQGDMSERWLSVLDANVEQWDAEAVAAEPGAVREVRSERQAGERSRAKAADRSGHQPVREQRQPRPATVDPMRSETDLAPARGRAETPVRQQSRRAEPRPPQPPAEPRPATPPSGSRGPSEPTPAERSQPSAPVRRRVEPPPGVPAALATAADLRPVRRPEHPATRSQQDMVPVRRPQPAQPLSQQNLQPVRRPQPTEHPAVRSQRDLPPVARPQQRAQAGQPPIPEHPALRSQRDLAPVRRPQPQAAQPPSQQNMTPARRPEHPAERSRQGMAPVRRTPPTQTAVNLPAVETVAPPPAARSRRAAAYPPAAESQPAPPPVPAAPVFTAASATPAPGWTDTEPDDAGAARHANPDATGGGRRRRADGDPAWYEAAARREVPLPEPPSTGSHGGARSDGRSVQDLLAAHGGEQGGGRRRRRRDDD